jgi:hypothetical protein
MRNRILAGVGIAALATVGLAAPANAVSPTTADIWVVHAVPATTVDVYINGALSIEDFAPGTVTPLVDVAPGDYTVDIVPAGDPAPAEGAGLITVDADVMAGVSYTLVAHPNAAGDSLLISPFVNDLAAAGAGNASVTVRHTAAAPAVDVVALPSTVLFPGVTNTQAGTTSVPAGEYDIQVQVAGSSPVAVAIDLPNTALAAGTHYFIHAFGAAGGPYSPIIFTIGDAPAGVPAGSAGLVADDGVNPALFAGGAVLLALLAAAGFAVARRQTVNAER